MGQLKTVPEFHYQDLSSLELKQALDELDGLDRTNRIPDDGIIRKSINSLLEKHKCREHYAIRLAQENLLREIANRWVEDRDRLEP